jgi:TorA maturation chaperone TorD
VLPWLPLFFMDLQDLRSAAFFRHVGVLGGVFLEAEKQYLIWLN